MHKDTSFTPGDPVPTPYLELSSSFPRYSAPQGSSARVLSATTMSRNESKQNGDEARDFIRMTFVHGFTQIGRSWSKIAAQMVDDYEVMLVDAPGHGGSSDIHVDLVDGAALLAKTAGQSIYVGYSMGGRLCLQLAVDHPHLVRALILLGATPGIEDEEERKRRYASDLVLAEQLDPSGDRSDKSASGQQERLDGFLRRWLEQPIFATLPPSKQDLDLRRSNTPSGLASSLRLASTGAQHPLWNRLGELGMPVLVMAGERDEKFSIIGQRMANAIGQNARFVSIPGAGHAAHLEKPKLFLEALDNFLKAIF